MKNVFPTIIKAGLLVGTLDISAAFLQFYLKYDKNPVENVLPFIASAVFGNEAFNGAGIMKVWGLLFHYGVAFTFTILFFLIYPKIIRIIKNKIILAILYGAFMWATMQYIVLPLTAAPALKFTIQSALIAIGILVICIATPLIMIAGKCYNKKQ